MQRSIERPLKLKEKEILGPELFERVGMVLSDTDGITVDIAHEATEEARRALVCINLGDYDLSFQSSEISSRDQISKWFIANGLKEGVARQIEKSIWNNPEVVSRARPIPGALETIRWIKESGRFTRFYTSRPLEQKTITSDWYDDSFPGLFESYMFSINEAVSYGGLVFKAIEAQEIAELMRDSRLFESRPTLLVLEDDPEHGIAIASHTQQLELDVVVGVIPYARIDNPNLYSHSLKNLFVIKRDSEDQNIWSLYEYLSGNNRSTLMEVS